MFSQSDIDQITAHGIPLPSAQRQQEIVCEEKPIEIIKPALKDDGVFSFGESEIMYLIADYKKQILDKSIIKFVPASGAATRMFKDLFDAWNNIKVNPSYQLSNATKLFFDKLPQFAFFDDLKQCMNQQGKCLKEAIAEKNYGIILEYLLAEKGLNYAYLPKGLLLFHQYDDNKRTAFEEHLAETAMYACNDDKIARLHFTVSEEHQTLFEKHCREVVPNYEKQFGIHYQIDFSVQHSSTDTIAFAQDNTPFRNEKDDLLFRPGGHGSLIENLNNLNADIVLIKNIDNVTLDNHKKDTVIYKKVLVSFLLKVQQQIFNYLNFFNNQTDNENIIAEIELFLKDNFFISLPTSYLNFSLQEKQEFLYQTLNRPIRICGMVKQENEPGGGPFWVKDLNDNLSLQIVEMSEMNLSDPKQQEILNNSQFFNPVDLACSLKNHKGEKFDLHKFIDHSRYFVSEKSHEGQILKAIENPGLWNGAMSNWLTVFVAVPLSTFSPVKTVNDLLRKEHSSFIAFSQSIL